MFYHSNSEPKLHLTPPTLHITLRSHV